MKKFVSLLCLILLFCVSPVNSQEYPNPKEGRFVNDFAELIDPNYEVVLEKSLKELQEKTTAEIAVVTIPSISPLTIEQYAVELFEKWGIGNAEKDNGVLIILAQEERKIRIEVGYGCEGFLPDGICGEIIRKVTPDLKKDKFGFGLSKAACLIMEKVIQEYEVTGVEIPEPPKPSGPNIGAILLTILAIFLIAFIIGCCQGDPFIYIFLILQILVKSGGAIAGGFGGGSSGGGGASGSF